MTSESRSSADVTEARRRLFEAIKKREYVAVAVAAFEAEVRAECAAELSAARDELAEYKAEEQRLSALVEEAVTKADALEDELDAARARADEATAILRAVKHDRPSAHTDELWARINAFLEGRALSAGGAPLDRGLGTGDPVEQLRDAVRGRGEGGGDGG